MKYILMLLLISCVSAPDRWNVEYGTGDGSMSSKGRDMDTDAEWVAVGVSGAIGGDEKLQPAQRWVEPLESVPVPSDPEPTPVVPETVESDPDSASFQVCLPSREPPDLPTPSWLVAVLSFAAGALSFWAWTWKGKAAFGGFFSRGAAPALLLAVPLGLSLVSCSSLKELPPMGAEIVLEGTPAQVAIADSHGAVVLYFAVAGRGALTLDGYAILDDEWNEAGWTFRASKDAETLRGPIGTPMPAGVLAIRPAAFWAALGIAVAP